MASQASSIYRSNRPPGDWIPSPRPRVVPTLRMEWGVPRENEHNLAGSALVRTAGDLNSELTLEHHQQFVVKVLGVQRDASPGVHPHLAHAVGIPCVGARDFEHDDVASTAERSTLPGHQLPDVTLLVHDASHLLELEVSLSRGAGAVNTTNLAN